MRIVEPCFLACALLFSCSVESDGPATGLGDGTAGSATTSGGSSGASDGSSSSSASAGDDTAPSESSSGTSGAPGSSDGDSSAHVGTEASSDGSASSEASSDESGTPLGEWDYGTCSNGCAADMCVVIQGFDGSFCTTPCIDGACPSAPDGEAEAQCLLGPDLTMPPVNCVLTCDTVAQDCPTGMTCVDAMMGASAGICLWQS